MATEASLEVVNLETPCYLPPHETIVGRTVELHPLRTDHAEQLYDTVGGDSNAALFNYMPYGPFTNLEACRDHVRKYSETTDPQVYAILKRSTGQIVGHLSFLRIDVPNRVIEIGHLIFSPLLQRTTEATELFYLLASKAFDCGYRRLEWKCDANNAASRRAALRLGHTFEGVFRQHMIRRGVNRDSWWGSIIDKEWPARRAAFEAWLDPGNFDVDGGQVKTLEAIREELGGNNL